MEYSYLPLEQPHQSIYSTHLFNKNIHSFTIFYYFLTHYPSLSHTQHYQKDTKILYARATIFVHICTVTVALVHLCIILYPLMWVFFWSKCAYLNIFSILHYFTLTDVSALIATNVI